MENAGHGLHNPQASVSAAQVAEFDRSSRWRQDPRQPTHASHYLHCDHQQEAQPDMGCPESFWEPKAHGIWRTMSKLIVNYRIPFVQNNQCSRGMFGLGFMLGLGVNEQMAQMWIPRPELRIRRKMRDIMEREVQTCDLKELVAKFMPELIGIVQIEKATQGIHPLQKACIRKVKILKAPQIRPREADGGK